MEAPPHSIVTYVFAIVFSAGGGGAVVLAALKWSMRREYVPRIEVEQLVNGYGERVNDLVVQQSVTDRIAQDAAQRVRSVEDEQRRAWERIAEQIVRPLEGITRSVQAINETQAVQTSTLEGICEWIKLTPGSPPMIPAPRPRRHP